MFFIELKTQHEIKYYKEMAQSLPLLILYLEDEDNS
jgi:hypothetical protein